MDHFFNTQKSLSNQAAFPAFFHTTFPVTWIPVEMTGFHPVIRWTLVNVTFTQKKESHTGLESHEGE